MLPAALRLMKSCRYARGEAERCSTGSLAGEETIRVFRTLPRPMLMPVSEQPEMIESVFLAHSIP